MALALVHSSIRDRENTSVQVNAAILPWVP